MWIENNFGQPRTNNRGKICDTPRCNNKARTKGLCLLCYQRKRRRDLIER